MTAYYNEIEPFAAEWLRNLIAAGLIAPGDVDTRSIEDVKPDDLKSYSQCHFFAGIGVWSHALRRAGWSDDRPVWTGSCPCPPFSAAGKGQTCPDCGSKRNIGHPRKTGHFICLACGCDRFADARHLWPEFSRLIRECRPAVVFGEQVASADGRLWLDTVSADLQNACYGFAGADLCAAGVGGPHIRQRLWFVAERLEHAALDRREQRRAEPGERGALGGCGTGGVGEPDRAGPLTRRQGTATPRHGRPSHAASRAGGLADATDAGCERRRPGEAGDGRDAAWIEPERLRDAGGMADAKLQQRQGSAPDHHVPGGRNEEPATAAGLRGDSRAGAHHGFWRDADWLFCRDGRWRPVSPGTFPLAHGAASRVGRLRAYGNAICAEAAETFIRAYDDIRLTPEEDIFG